MRSTRILALTLWSFAIVVGSAAVLQLIGSGGLTKIAALSRSQPVSVSATSSTVPASTVIPAVRLAARGRVEPAAEPLQLAIALVGTLDRVYVDEGDTVAKGQLLATLVNRDQQARVDEANATLQLREAEFDKLMNGARPEERRQVAAQLEEMKANLVLAKREIERRRPLAAKGVASQQSLDQAVSSLGTAEAQTAARQASLDLIMAPPRDEDIATARSNVALARATLEEQRSLLAKTELHSPIDGVVLRRYLQTGETISIQPLIPILEIGNTSHLRVRAEIDETDVARIQLGQRVTISADAYPDRKFDGTVVRVGKRMGRKKVGSDEPTEKSDTNVLDVLIDLDAGARLPIGLRVDVITEATSITQN